MLYIYNSSTLNIAWLKSADKILTAAQMLLNKHNCIKNNFNPVTIQQKKMLQPFRV